MSINELVIRGSTSISLHERFTSLKRPGQTSQGQPANDSLNDSGYNRSGYGDDHSVGPALRAATSVPSYTPAVRAEQYNRGGYFRSGNTGQSSQPYYERYNPEQPHYQPPQQYNYSHRGGYDRNTPNYTPYNSGYSNGYSATNYMPRRTPAAEAALRLKRRSLKQRLGMRPNNFDTSNWQRNNGFGGNYLRYHGRSRQGNRGFGKNRWNSGNWIRARGGFRPRSRSMGRWGSTVSLSSDGMGRGRRPRSNSFSGGRMGWARGGRRGRGRRGWRTSDGKPPTKEQLDQQIDSYMASTKSAMDKELDTYMQEGAAFK